MGYLVLLLLGPCLVGVIFFGVLMPFSTNERALVDCSSRLGIYVFPKMYLRKYYRPERLWVRMGFSLCSGGLFVTLFFVFILSLSSGGLKIKTPEARGNPPFNININ